MPNCETSRAVAAELAEVSLGPATKFAALPDPFPFWRGGALSEGRVAYETWGALNAARDNAVLLFTGLSPSAHAASLAGGSLAGLVGKMVGPGKAIDTDRYFVVCVNSLGSCFGSSGPASIDPATGLAYRLDFPDLSVEDIARGGYEAIRSLGIERLSAVVGASLGGMAVLAFAAQFAGVARRVISISGSPAAIAVRHRAAFDCSATPSSRIRIGRMASIRATCARSRACAWRASSARSRIARPRSGSTASAAARLPTAATRTLPPGRAHFPAEFAVQDYLNAQADKFVSVFDPNCYLYLSRAIDRFDLSAHGGTPAAALKRAAAERALVIGVESDILFTINEQNADRRCLRANAGTATDFVPLASLEGHDAFLVDIEPFAAAIGQIPARISSRLARVTRTSRAVNRACKSRFLKLRLKTSQESSKGAVMKHSNLAERLEEFVADSSASSINRSRNERASNARRRRQHREAAPRRLSLTARAHPDPRPGPASVPRVLTTWRGRREDRRQRAMQHRADGAQQLAFFHRELLVVRDAAHQPSMSTFLANGRRLRQARQRIGRALSATAPICRVRLADVRAAPPRCPAS